MVSMVSMVSMENFISINLDHNDSQQIQTNQFKLQANYYCPTRTHLNLNRVDASFVSIFIVCSISQLSNGSIGIAITNPHTHTYILHMTITARLMK